MERVSLVGGGAILFNPQGPILGIGSFGRVFVGKNQASGELVGSPRLSAALSLALSLTNPPPNNHRWQSRSAWRGKTCRTSSGLR